MNSDEHQAARPRHTASVISVPAGGAFLGVSLGPDGQWYARIDVPVQARDRIAIDGGRPTGVTIAAAPPMPEQIRTWPPSRIKRCRFKAPPAPRIANVPAAAMLLDQLDRIRMLYAAANHARG